MESIAWSSCAERRRHHTDALGSVLARTDASGSTVARFDYQPWGEQWTTPAVQGDRQYNGRVCDPGTGFHDYGARMYWPQIGRFVSADTYSGEVAKPVSINRYTCVYNSPFKYVDPTGREVYPTDARAAELIAQLRQDPRGAALYDYLNSSPYIYMVTGDAPVPIGISAFGQFTPGIAEGKNKCSVGGSIDLYESEVRRDRYNPVANLAHELTHAGLFDNQSLGRAGAPEPILRFAGSAVNGALPDGPHHVMENYWQWVLGGGR